MDRRDLLKMIAAATGAAMVGIPAFANAADAPAGDGMEFTPEDIAKLDEVADTILPRTSTPGAKEAGVGAFMATFAADCYAPRVRKNFRDGLVTLDERAGGRFVALAPEARTTLLRELDAEATKQRRSREAAQEAAEDPDDVAANLHWFTLVKQLAIFGFFTSQVGANEVLRFVPVPGRYDGDVPYVPGTPAWATS